MLLYTHTMELQVYFWAVVFENKACIFSTFQTWYELQIYLTVFDPYFDWIYQINIITKIVRWCPTRVEAQFLQSRSYFFYIPENGSEVEIVVWNLYQYESWGRREGGDCQQTYYSVKLYTTPSVPLPSWISSKSRH